MNTIVTPRVVCVTDRFFFVSNKKFYLNFDICVENAFFDNTDKKSLS